MILATIIISLAYLLTLFWFAIGFKKVEPFKQKYQAPVRNFSIVIPFRNEAERITQLLVSIKDLSYPNDKFEVLFINDQSTDNGATIIEEAFRSAAIDFKIIDNQRLSGSPKKDAITFGVKNAKYDWILTTDADCALPEFWLSAYDLLISEHNPEMVMGPVFFGLGKAHMVLRDLIITESNALQIAAIGSLGNRNPILANGANLGYKKSWFIANNGYKDNNHIASGDDVFLLQLAQKTGAKVSYLTFNQAVVYTHQASHWRDYFRQRIRWASKTTQVPNALSKFLGAIIAITNLWWILLLIAFCIHGEIYSFWVAFALSKALADYLFLRLGRSLFKPDCVKLFLVSSLLYPFASTAVVIGTKLGGYTWKDRRFKK